MRAEQSRPHIMTPGLRYIPFLRKKSRNHRLVVVGRLRRPASSGEGGQAANRLPPPPHGRESAHALCRPPSNSCPPQNASHVRALRSCLRVPPRVHDGGGGCAAAWGRISCGRRVVGAGLLGKVRFVSSDLELSTAHVVQGRCCCTQARTATTMRSFSLWFSFLRACT